MKRNRNFKFRISISTLAYLLVIVFTLDCSAQSVVADAARKERERRKNVRSAVTITGVTPAGASTTSPTTTAAPAPPPPVVKPVEPTDNNGRDEKYWRAAFQKGRDDLKRSDEKVQLLEVKIKDLNTQLLRQSDIYNREYRLGPQITEAQKQLDDARKEAEQARQKITGLDDELRKSGGLPGWAR